MFLDPQSKKEKKAKWRPSKLAITLPIIMIVFAGSLLGRSVFFMHMQRATDQGKERAKRAEIDQGRTKRLQDGETAEKDSFVVHLATVLEFVRSREKYKCSNRELFLDYVQHVSTKTDLAWLKKGDVVIISHLCSKNPMEATIVRHKL